MAVSVRSTDGLLKYKSLKKVMALTMLRLSIAARDSLALMFKSLWTNKNGYYSEV